MDSLLEHAVPEITSPDLVVSPTEVQNGKESPVGGLGLPETLDNGLGKPEHLVQC